MEIRSRILNAIGGKPKAKAELAALLNCPKKALTPALDALVEEGVLQRLPKGYVINQNGLTFEGRVDMNERGFAFIIREGGPDVFVPGRRLGGAMHGDIVLCALRGDEGEVLRVLSHTVTQVVGTVRGQALYPDDRRLPIMQLTRKPASDGYKVVARIKSYGVRGDAPTAKPVEILGAPGETGVDILSIIREHGWRTEFSEEARAQAAEIPGGVSHKDCAGREDLRHLSAFTLDGEDARDFDDAISYEPLPDGARLGVHIADVAHYVPEGSPIDQEAYLRGTSVYLADRVIPMLPEQLSCGICSLNPGVDRLTLSVLMDLDAQGTVTHTRIVRAVIRSRMRLTYEEVNAHFGKGAPPSPPMRAMMAELEPLMALAGTLKRRRAAMGALDLDIRETHIELDPAGRPISVAAAETGPGNAMIEQFMVLCNEEVAKRARQLALPFMYRVHEEPDADKMAAFAAFVSTQGYTLRHSDSVAPRDLAQLLSDCSDAPEARVISRVMLRSLMKARYSDRCFGHFGLSLKDYCHFTAPIRRYPDLIAHRVLIAQLAGKLGEKRKAALEKVLDEQAAHLSRCERSADETERDVENLKKTEYMQQFIGEEYDGIIEGITSTGFFVGLPSTVEGFVRLASLNVDHFTYDEARYRLVGARTGVIYRLGDRVRIQVQAAYLPTRKIEFSLCGGPQ